MQEEIESLKSYYFECQCLWNEHALVVSWDEQDNVIYTEVFLNQYLPCWRRIIAAVRYVFGLGAKKSHWDTFLLRPQDAQRLTALLSKVTDEMQK